MNLRFIERDNKKILQQFMWNATTAGEEWQDVPLVKEPKKAREWLVNLQTEVLYLESDFDCAPPKNLIKVREVLENE